MLNLLSGRLLSKNLKLRGTIKINGKKVETMADYKSVIGYVMQEDLMLPTFTPRETFRFITDMRLPFKTSEEKDALVESMIDSLGLKKASETYVGNSLIRGLSGGEKKRTSVGVELLINPSLIFLDEPTTGLDSTTALNLIRFLNRLANAGRTVVTTIHQPSSEIFLEFDVILLMLDGNVVYHSRASESMRYFSNLGLPVPIHSNPMDHYMKLMNKEGISLRKIEEGKPVVDEEVAKEFD